VQQYETVRIAEGRETRDPDQLRALPFRDLSGKRPYEWCIRSRTYKAFIECVIEPLERQFPGPLRIMDLGSGVGWLAYRLTVRGHEVAAVDLVSNDFDGLGTHHRFGPSFTSLQAEFDRLPFQGESVDIVVYNAAFHYAIDYAVTLREALRVLAPDGRVVILDTPLYHDSSSGAAMVREREQGFERQYGFRGEAIRTEGFLTYDRLDALQDQCGLRWTLCEPWYGVRWLVKPWLARLRGLREPARFKLIVGQRLARSMQGLALGSMPARA